MWHPVHADRFGYLAEFITHVIERDRDYTWNTWNASAVRSKIRDFFVYKWYDLTRPDCYNLWLFQQWNNHWLWSLLVILFMHIYFVWKYSAKNWPDTQPLPQCYDDAIISNNSCFHAQQTHLKKKNQKQHIGLPFCWNPLSRLNFVRVCLFWKSKVRYLHYILLRVNQAISARQIPRTIESWLDKFSSVEIELFWISLQHERHFKGNNTTILSNTQEPGLTWILQFIQIK